MIIRHDGETNLKVEGRLDSHVHIPHEKSFVEI